MLEAVLTYDLVPGASQQAYQAWAKNSIGTTLRQAGLIEFRAHRNILGSPQVRITAVWHSMADMEKFWLGDCGAAYHGNKPQVGILGNLARCT